MITTELLAELRKRYQPYAIGPADALIAALEMKLAEVEAENEELKAGLVPAGFVPKEVKR